uniref:Pyruvate phosphate dikinase AMP/ATP-binding domain-containing protein n=1 Tax=Musa acuminata subsp. malaccensis TaxID=214687 RepID=A0A804KJQ6_MUSAM|nr:PREDICTED: alpha-glucan water dikinase 2 isoform X1 [Musa acuminata subsp. malaccensis]XP_018674023.1 PREDICTED: alpha-glucan water dikinase 2 isoform X1 [Musa acuminata subsp. malaccensis]
MSSLKPVGSRQTAVVHRFDLGDGIQLQANVNRDSNSSITTIELLNCSRPLILHWGGICSGKNHWVLPNHYPPGSKIYKGEALQTPFAKKGATYSITIELHDPKFDAIEYVLKDEKHHKWFKSSQGNFRINIPKFEACASRAMIPKDIIEHKAYLIWERKGRPTNSPQEKEEDYETALRELNDQLLRGMSMDEIRSSLKNQNVQTVSGFKELQMPGNTIIAAVYHKQYDVSQWLSKQSLGHMKGTPLCGSSLVNLVEKTLGTDNVKMRQIYNIGNNELVVLLKNVSSESHIILAVNLKGDTILHWGVSRTSAGEWLVPPPEILPERSKMLNGACQTIFKEISDGQKQFQYVDINLRGRHLLGVQFVLWSGGSWLKNNGSNFYIGLKSLEQAGEKQGEGNKIEICKWLLDEIAQREKDAERSLMHRFNIATELMERCRHERELGLIGMLVWLRFMACRELCWNKNYNVKPREISAAQDKFTDLLQRTYQDQKDDRENLRLIMATVGRGGQGDVGQRIRDEILILQRNNDCKGGMMEEWHQKLHNNSSPDDVIICQALLDYVKSNFDISIYWRTLNSNGLTKAILASYDRPIVSEPHFRADKKQGLIHDLSEYLKTLKAVHSGDDLESAIATCLAHLNENYGFMNTGNGHSDGYFSLKLKESLNFIQSHAGDKNIVPFMEKLLEARIELRGLLFGTTRRLKYFIYLDLALELALKTCMEKSFSELKKAPIQGIMSMVSLMLENLCLSTVNNEELVFITKDWYRVCNLFKPNDQQWSLQTKAVLDRMQLALADKAQYYLKMIQPTAEYLGKLLRVETCAVASFTEELIRTGCGGTLAILVNHLSPILRNIANLGSWQIISPVEVCGFVDCVNKLIEVQSKVFNRPTILISNRVTGEEEIPYGVVGVLTPDMPDVLSHVAIRARNNKICFASCFDQDIIQDLKSKKGKEISITLKTSGLIYSEFKSSSSSNKLSSFCPRVTLRKKNFSGKFAISAEEFSCEMVGAKANNIEYIRGKLPSWIKLPRSVALPFGVFETSISSDINKDLAKKISLFKGLVNGGDIAKLQMIRNAILEMKAPFQLMNELKHKMKKSFLYWPGDESEERWNQAWQAIKKVWASKWNERAYLSCRKAKLDHDDLCMAVLIQEVISADYAFVLHTRNPLSGNPHEIYAEIVKGLGETLVGAYPGRSMSFVTNKSALNSASIIGYPSKQIGLFVKKSLIFRSDSNGEDLHGYAGAGLYDSVTMDEAEKVLLDYSSDRLISDKSFQQSIFKKVAEAGKIIEGVYGSAQDIEGVVKDGEIYIVQTRPQI